MSSTRRDKTRLKLLEAAEAVFIERGYNGVGLEAVADSAGVTRQTVYNQFGSKAGLLAAVAAHVEEAAGLPRLLMNVTAQTDGMSMLRALLDTVVVVEPLLRPHIRLTYAGRLDDPLVADLWQNRMQSRYMGMLRVMTLLNKEGKVRPELSVEEATDVAWSLMSPHHFEYLVIERGWPIARYRTHLEDAITQLLLKLVRARSRKTRVATRNR